MRCGSNAERQNMLPHLYPHSTLRFKPVSSAWRTPRNVRQAATLLMYPYNRFTASVRLHIRLLNSFIYSTIARNFARKSVEFCIFSRSTWIYALVIYIFLCICAIITKIQRNVEEDLGLSHCILWDIEDGLLVHS